MNQNVPITRAEMDGFKQDKLRRICATSWFPNRKQRRYAYNKQSMNPVFGQMVNHWQTVWNKAKNRFVQIPHFYPSDYKGGKS